MMTSEGKENICFHFIWIANTLSSFTLYLKKNKFIMTEFFF